MIAIHLLKLKLELKYSKKLKLYKIYSDSWLNKQKTKTRQSQWPVDSFTVHSARERRSSPFLGLEPAASLHSSLAARNTR